MEEEGTQLIYVPIELIHHIQSLLPEKDAARTCVLSKSWLHAWSTIPTLRFTTCAPDDHLNKQKELQYIKLIDDTLLRYLNQNLSVKSIKLHIDIDKLSLPSPVENWFQVLASGNCLKELSLTICGKKLNKIQVGWLTIPDAIFSCENLNELIIRADKIELYEVRMNLNPAMIKCSYLVVLILKYVSISDAALHNLFSSCRLLEKVVILGSQHLKNIRVKNLSYLRHLQINSKGDNVDSLEIYDVPSLRLISYENYARQFTMRMDTLTSVRELYLCSMKLADDTFSKMIVSKFPFLETLWLLMPHCALETFEITCVSLKRVTLDYRLSDKQMNIKIYASKLLYFSYRGLKMPSLLFPSSTPAHIKLVLRLHKSHPIDLFFFLKVRKALDSSSSFDIKIMDNFVPFNIDLDDLRRMIPFPARNVQHLSFGKGLDEKLWRHSPLVDFLFSICYPRYVKTYHRSSNGRNYWYEQMAGMMEQKTCDLRDIEIKNPGDGKWETLTNSRRSYHFLFELPWRSFYEEGKDYYSDEFKLNWWS